MGSDIVLGAIYLLFLISQLDVIIVSGSTEAIIIFISLWHLFNGTFSFLIIVDFIVSSMWVKFSNIV